MLAEAEHRIAKHRDQPARPEADILIVGPYPPPLGGVSSHVQRAADVLSESGYVVHVLNHFSSLVSGVVIGTLRRNPALYYLKLRKVDAKVVHYHHAGRLSLLLATALARTNGDTRRIVTIHNHSLTRAFGLPIVARLVKAALSRFDQIVAVSHEIKDVLEQHHINVPTVVMPAYISASAANKAPVSDWLPAPFFEGADITLVVSAYRVTRWSSSRGDVYGLDVAAKVFTELAMTMPDVKLAIFLAHTPKGRWAKRYLRSTMQLISPELADRVKLWVGEQLSPAFGYRTIYLRPTRTDGDAVSVREALDAGVPVIASDIVDRPPAVRTLATDASSLWKTTIGEEVTRLSAKTAAVVHASRDNGHNESVDAILGLYRTQLGLVAATRRER